MFNYGLGEKNTWSDNEGYHIVWSADGELIKRSLDKDPRVWPQWAIEKLQEWHIDHQGLIDKKLALDKSTLKK